MDKRYTDLMLVEDIAKALVKRIRVLIKDKKADGFVYLEVYHGSFAGLDSSGVRDRVISKLSKEGYNISYGLGGDKFEVSWPIKYP